MRRLAFTLSLLTGAVPAAFLSVPTVPAAAASYSAVEILPGEAAPSQPAPVQPAWSHPSAVGASATEGAVVEGPAIELPAGQAPAAAGPVPPASTVPASRPARTIAAAPAAGVSYSRPALDPFGADYWTGYWTDGKAMVTAPARFTPHDWLVAGGVAATAGTLFLLDQPIRRFAQSHRNGTTNAISDAVTPLGDGFYVLPALAGAYAVGRYTDDPRLQDTALLSVENFALTGIMVQVGKYAFHRWRPRESNSAYKFSGPSLSNSHLSLPSGDTGVAFSVASVIAHEYPDSLWVAPTSYSLATLVALERINKNAHFASDVFIGGALGYFAGGYLVKLHQDPNVHLGAMLGPDGQGLQLNMAF